MVYRSGTSLARSEESTRLRLPFPGGMVIDFHADIVDEDIPLLLGSDVMRKHKLVLDFVENVVRSGFSGD